MADNIIQPPVIKSILKNGFPPLGAERNISGSSRNVEAHDEAEIVVSDFELTNRLSLAESPSLIWVLYEKAGDLNYASKLLSPSMSQWY